MHPRTCIISALTLGTAMSLGIVAMAADLSKEGAYKGTYFGYGTYKTNSLSKDRTIAVFDETGLMVTDGFSDHTTAHCWGMTDYIKGMGEDQGYCIATDASGDKMLVKISGEKHGPDQKSWKNTSTCIEGTGRYVGVSCSETDLILGNEFPSTSEGTYVSYVTLQGTYKVK